jgi:hydrogenase maturation protease
MANLREQLERCFQGRVCLVGVGNVDLGDDGFGVRLAEALSNADLRFAICDLRVMVAGKSPERYLTEFGDDGFDHLIFVDAVEFGGAPGSVVFLDTTEMIARFPQISTHKISLGTLAKWFEAKGRTRAWLLGVQPESLKPGPNLTPAIHRTLEVLTGLLRELVAARSAGLRPGVKGKNASAAPARRAALHSTGPARAQSAIS